ncbi:MAG: hypothetical protein AAGA20_20940, partial [Planctomycetota bacterium]
MQLPARLSLLPLLLHLGTLATAQDLPTIYVADRSDQVVWTCTDLDLDGTYNGPTETTVFYDGNTGAVPLSDNRAIWHSDDGAVWVGDQDEEIIVRLFDANDDGDAQDVGEATVWFDGRSGGNAGGVIMTSVTGLWRDPDGVFFVSSNNTTSGGVDAILRLEDLNQDGDANDAGEAVDFYLPFLGGAVGQSIPTSVVRGADGAIYYAENGITSNPPRGAYRLEDLDGSGTIDQANEVTPYFIAPPQAGNAFHWEITIDANGTIYLGDNGNEIIWRLVDADMSGAIDPATEATQYWTAGGSSTIWDIDIAPDGTLYVAEDQTPDRLLRFVDVNSDGTIDPVTEVFELYNETISPNPFGSAYGLALVDTDPGLGTNYCDANANSTGARASITASGSTTVADNDFTLECSSMPNFSFSFFLTSRVQSFVVNPGGSAGNLCLGG